MIMDIHLDICDISQVFERYMWMCKHRSTDQYPGIQVLHLEAVVTMWSGGLHGIQQGIHGPRSCTKHLPLS